METVKISTQTSLAEHNLQIHVVLQDKNQLQISLRDNNARVADWDDGCYPGVDPCMEFH